MYFDKTSAVFTATYQVDTNVPAPTDLYFNQDYFYQNGYTLELYSEGSVITDYEVDDLTQNHLYILIKNPSYLHKEISIKLSPK